MHNKLKKQFPIKIRIIQHLVSICLGMFKGLYFKKYRMILDYIENDSKELIEKYKNIHYTPTGTIPKQIWVLWYDNNNLKEIPKACISRMQNIRGYKAIIVTKENLSSYIEIKDIQDLLEKGYISIQFFSDMVRARLLRKYGGFWLDSTIAIENIEFLDIIVSNYKFFSIKLEKFHKWQSVSEGKFSSYFWATCPENPFWEYVDDCFTLFLTKHRTIIDYYQIDYTIMSGYEKIPFIRMLLDSIPPTNPDIFWLTKQLNKPFSEEKWNEITTCTSIFKLSWRVNPSIDSEKEPKETTYWQHLLNIWY